MRTSDPAPTHAAAGTGVPASGPGRDRLWDSLRSVALVRVIVWHSYTWTPLSWFAAIPAMFLAAGVLLEGSLTRHGYLRTLSGRLRRLLLPYWAYATATVATMMLLGWRPTLERSGDVFDLLWWILPLGDPTGTSEAPGLWIPLWYLRAYLWFLLAAGILGQAARRLGWFAPLLLGAAFTAQQTVFAGAPAPLVEFLLYAPFVSAGMVLYHRHIPATGSYDGTAHRKTTSAAAHRTMLIRALLIGGVLIGVVAAVLLTRSGVWPVVVNESYPATFGYGLMTVVVTLALAPLLRRDGTGPVASLITYISRRSLSLYLWHGFGLFAADRLVTRQGIEGPFGLILSGTVVLGVSFAAAGLFGPLEDISARRTRRSEPTASVGAGEAPTIRSRRRELRRSVQVVSVRLLLGAALTGIVASAAVTTPNSNTEAAMPLSGRGALQAAAEFEAALETAETTFTVAPGHVAADATVSAERFARVGVFLEQWAQKHAAEYARRGITYVNLVYTTNDGETTLLRWEKGRGTRRTDPSQFPAVRWYSQTKAATAGWMYLLTDAGVVSPSDPLSRYLPEVPNSDRITLHQLATHTSGIPRSYDSPDSATTDPGADVRRYMTSGELAREPGSGFEYSRVGYTLLGWALERASGISWRAAMTDIAARAGVELGFDEDLVELADGSNRHPGEGTYRGPLYSSGGLVASLSTMAELYQWLLADGLRPASVEAMLTIPASSIGYAAGVGVQCPCRPNGELLSGSRAHHASFAGSYAHDRVSAATYAIRPEIHLGGDGEEVFLTLFHGSEFRSGLLEAISGPGTTASTSRR